MSVLYIIKITIDAVSVNVVQNAFQLHLDTANKSYLISY